MKIILICLFLFSFKSESKTLNNLAKRWVGLQSIENINSKISQGKPIVMPKGTIQYLFTVAFFDRGFNLNYDCIYYKVPFDGEKGIFFVTKNYTDIRCMEYSDYDSSFIQHKVKLLSFEVDKGVIIDTGKEKISFLKLPLKVASNVSEVMLKPRRKLENGEICEEVDDECNVKKSQCNQCKNGFYPVIKSACQKKYTKRCGPSNCGNSGWPACIRGYVASKYKLDYCINDSPLAFCRPGLKVLCIDGELVCR